MRSLKQKYLADSGYTKEDINKFNLQDYLSYSIPIEEDLIQCKQLIIFYIFIAKICKDQTSTMIYATNILVRVT